MTKFQSSSILISVIMILPGCTSLYNPPLIFGQGHIVGISISGSMPEQKADLTIGYKDADIAIVPVTVKQGNGDSTQIKATATGGFVDGISVFGQFEANVNRDGEKEDKASIGKVDVGLGKFFATGMAAKKLADGFADKLSSEKKNEKQDIKTPQAEENKTN